MMRQDMLASIGIIQSACQPENLFALVFGNNSSSLALLFLVAVQTEILACRIS